MTRTPENGKSLTHAADLHDLRDRMERATNSLHERSHDATTRDNRLRLLAKCNGVYLAISYLDELIADVERHAHESPDPKETE